MQLLQRGARRISVILDPEGTRRREELKEEIALLQRKLEEERDESERFRVELMARVEKAREGAHVLLHTLWSRCGQGINE